MPVNTAALKTFAPAMRRQLLEAVGRKLDLLLNSQTPDTLSTYAKQIAELREQEAENRDQLLERVAYTWFNRLCALRYIDARGWHPFGCKVLMPSDEAETQPELLKLMRAGSLPKPDISNGRRSDHSLPESFQLIGKSSYMHTCMRAPPRPVQENAQSLGKPSYLWTCTVLLTRTSSVGTLKTSPEAE